MTFENPTHYDLLEITPDASPQDVRAAYLRAKSAYKRDSVALYTLIDEDETEALLQRIEEAYLVLSNPEKRREYDRQFGLLSLEPSNDPFGSELRGKVVSIDRVPPMDRGGDHNLLVPPTTDFSPEHKGAAAATATSVFDINESSYNELSTTSGNVAHAHAPQFDSTPRPVQAERPRPAGPMANSVIAEEIQREIVQQVDWRGAFLRKVREARRLSIEELADFTKISKTYLHAIEDENYAKLPAAVYLRGFVTQFSKALKLPFEQVVAAYMGRYLDFLREKESK